MNQAQVASGGARPASRYSPLKIGGVLYVVAVFQFFIFELVAETLYPGYSVAHNYISDLGAKCANPPSTLHCVVHQPTATIFDTTVVLLGAMLLAGTIFVYLGTRRKLYFVVSAVTDVAILLVGVLPENTGWPHAILSEILFIGVGISLILAWTIAAGDVIRYLTVVLGALTLFFSVSNGRAVVGVGGQERLLVLSGLLGVLALGGYLTGQDARTSVVSTRESVSVRTWTLAAVVVTAVTLGLVVSVFAMVLTVTRTHIDHLGTVVSLLTSLILPLLVTSAILWVVTAVRRLARRHVRPAR